MTDTRFPTLAAVIDHMPTQQRHTTALALSDSTQPLLQALGIELMRANITQERDLARHEADYERDQAEALAVAAGVEHERLAELGWHGTTAADLERTETAVAEAMEADRRHERAQQRAHELTERLREPKSDGDTA